MSRLSGSNRKFGIRYTADFCLEFSLILKAGITVSEGLLLLAQDEKDQSIRQILTEMQLKTDQGARLSHVFAESRVFPKYLCDMLAIAEETGRLEATFFALSEYYERRLRITRNIRTAVTYPILLGIMMLAVVFILMTEVVPVFNEVSIQIGVTPTAIAVSMAKTGVFLKEYAVPLLLFFVILVFFAVRIGKRVMRHGKTGFEIAAVRFSSAVEMIIKSGLHIEDSLDMLQRLNDHPEMRECISRCGVYLSEGLNFPAAAEKAGIYNAVFSRMLGIGFKTGSLDFMMSEIAARSEEQFNEKIERTVGLIEPVLIILLSLLAGFILLSVMLPLLHILSFMR